MCKGKCYCNVQYSQPLVPPVSLINPIITTRRTLKNYCSSVITVLTYFSTGWITTYSWNLSITELQIQKVSILFILQYRAGTIFLFSFLPLSKLGAESFLRYAVCVDHFLVSCEQLYGSHTLISYVQETLFQQSCHRNELLHGL